MAHAAEFVPFGASRRARRFKAATLRGVGFAAMSVWVVLPLAPAIGALVSWLVMRP